MDCPDKKVLEEIFPASKTNDFFDALYGGEEEGAYDIHLVCKSVTASIAKMAFELRRREGKCLVCSLTYGLPAVFERHPIINMPQIAQKIAEHLGWDGPISWAIEPVREINNDLHIIPFEIKHD